MKKILLLICLLLVASCSKKGINEVSGVGMANPVVERSSLEEVNKITHGHITKPGVMGISEERFSTIEMSDKGMIGQYNFTLNGAKYTLRFSDTILKEDISGVWINGKSAFDDNLGNLRVSGEGYKLARWFNVDGQYTFIAPDTIEDFLFEDMVKELTSLSSTNGNS